MKVDLKRVEEAAKELYIRALKQLPPDIKQGFDALAKRERDAGAKRMLGTMIRNIQVAEDTDNLLCQDTGIPVYNVRIGRDVQVEGAALKEAIRAGCASPPPTSAWFARFTRTRRSSTACPLISSRSRRRAMRRKSTSSWRSD